MALTEKDVKHVARLARLSLSDEERERLRGQLERILDYMKNLEKHATGDVPPTSHVAPLSNVWRPDEVRRWEDVESILANAPERENSYFKVKKVIEP
ncbi:MAG TPA: Asp-tRNA(Asn)/Glu-tRNA(Gln) amidotransferase subunit GatC [Elusimicrobiota bacterium]|nr:Asp-tRNA(Asn)/Glu-tRNA(Gln) amidotransferase subunit GatC [Elusimicrobiota bacterium]